MNRAIPFFILLSFIIFSQIETQAQCFQPQLPTTECNMAPTVCPTSGLLDEYCGTNDDFNFDPNFQPPNFCGTIQNPDWIGFIPITTNVDIHIYVEACTSPLAVVPALQVMAFKSCEFDWEPVSDCIYELYTNTSQTLSLTNLDPGEVHYLLLDGFSGAICNYYLEVTSGAIAGYGDALQADAGADNFIECNSSVILDASNSTATPTTNYTWSDENGNVVGTGITYTATATGTYTLYLNDSDISICPSEDEVQVFEAGVTTLELGDGNYLDCNTGIATIIGENVPSNPNYTYSWMTTNGNFLSGETTANPVVDAVGEYILTMVDGINNCSKSDTISVMLFEDVLTVDSIFQKTCTSSGNFDLNATALAFDSPDFIYAWTTTDGNIVSNENKQTPRINELGTYNITFTDTVSGCVFMDEVLVVDTLLSPTPIIDFVGNQYLTCDLTNVELTAENSIILSPVTYKWRKPSGVVFSTGETAIVDQGGIYTLELMVILTGCVYSTEVEVIVDDNAPDVIFPLSTYGLNCANNFTQEIIPIINNGPNIGFEWSYNGFIISNNINIIVSSGEEGIYDLTVTNFVNGCSSQAMIEVVDNGFAVDITTVNATCDAADGTAMISSGLANPLYEWSNGVQGSVITGLTQGWYSVTITDLDNNCSKHQNFFVDEDISCKVVISGYVVIDDNNTCTYDPAMEGIELIMVKLYPLEIYTYTDSTGYYEFVVEDGDYSVQYISNIFYDLLCPVPGIYDVTLNTNGTSDNDNHFFIERVETDLCITKINGNAVPGLKQFNLLEVCNFGQLTQTATVTFTHDDLFGQVASLPNIEPLNTNAENYIYDSNNKTFTWMLNELEPGECRKISWFMETPTTAQVGQIITSAAEVTPNDFDVNPTNNNLNWNGVVTASLDPNIKQNYVGETLSGGAIYEDDTTMDYLIHFQNIGTDTAYTVVIRDTLDDAHLNVTTLRGFTSSHDMQVEYEDTNVLIFRFENIYLVDSLTNEEASKGWVGFQIDLLPNQDVGTEISNQAAIYFDYNEPIITNEVVNTIDQHFYKIEGEVKTEIGEGVKDVNALLSGDLVAATLTDLLGVFSFEDLNPNESFAVDFEKNTNPWNGVTTQDIVAIRKHILGLEYLDSPYKLLAADVNNSGSITGLDMALIRSLILLNILEFPTNPSWKIIDGNYVFPDPTQPWGSSIPISLTIDNINEDRSYNLIGIKMGDVNNSVQPWNLLDSETREREDVLNLSIDNQEVSVGEEYVVALRAKDFKDMVAYQFTLGFDKNKLRFTGFEEGVLETMSEQNIGSRFLKNGKLTIAWTSSEGKNINEDEPLFFLKFKAKQKGEISEMLEINSSKTTAVAYDEEEDIFDINLIFEGEEKNALIQIFPNPTNENIFVNINLEKTISIQLDIFNAFGQLEKSVLSNTIQAKGFFQQKINVQKFSPGTYFIKMKMGEEIVVRKFIVM
ncbi:MAG: T9SS type A sorting domain-containing protein [Saprospiraceae bacterium]